ncbi:MAG: hypothetical protein WKG00_36510, partial [Polyangiaceae bacterium]
MTVPARRVVDTDLATPVVGAEAPTLFTPFAAPMLVRSGGRVAWTRLTATGNCAGGALVESVRLDGTEPGTAPGQPCYDPIPALVVDQSIAFWTWSNGEGTRLSKTSFPGATTTLLMTVGSISRIAVSSDAVFFAHVDPVAPPTLYRV